MEWIKVDDLFFRSASIGDCLLLFENGDVRRLLEQGLPLKKKITHWMPLPAPPTNPPPTDYIKLSKEHAAEVNNR